jgi:hypothetical protein
MYIYKKVRKNYILGRREYFLRKPVRLDCHLRSNLSIIRASDAHDWSTAELVMLFLPQDDCALCSGPIAGD